ncbi:unnamed protein product [Oikopleura dioica]|uniref:Uncharacterized protein n=1 Tax=Oikopleura dioica TaxID=34765 RepID=E4XA83_OIKDI|nr:unnamed protein product [Oikopleura dioica]
MEIRVKDSSNIISSKSLSEKDISRLTRTRKHERNNEQLRRSRRSPVEKNDGICETKTKEMDSSALKKHLCKYHFDKIRHGVINEGYLHSEVYTSKHCSRNLIIVPSINKLHTMPTSCELSSYGESQKDDLSCLRGAFHCKIAVAKRICKKMAMFYEQVVPKQEWHIDYDKDVNWGGFPKCQRDMTKNPELKCGEVPIHHYDPLATKFDFYYIVRKKMTDREFLRAKMQFVISIRNHAICAARLEFKTR